MPLASSIPSPFPILSEVSSKERSHQKVDIYYSADVETDGPIPGPYSMLSMGLVVAGVFDGKRFTRPEIPSTFYRELKPISENFDPGALAVNQLDRERLKTEGSSPESAMCEAIEWIASTAEGRDPVLVAYPLSFDWTWLYWYFINFAKHSPFNHSRCFDIKTAYAVKARVPVSGAGRTSLPQSLLPEAPHTHNALDDALEQAEIFARVFEWDGVDEGRD